MGNYDIDKGIKLAIIDSMNLHVSSGSLEIKQKFTINNIIRRFQKDQDLNKRSSNRSIKVQRNTRSDYKIWDIIL